MHACADLLEEILELLRREERAMEEEDIDTVEELARQRAGLMEKAWNARGGYAEEALREALARLLAAQRRLSSSAHALHGRYREQRRNARKQSKYFDGDRQVHADLQKSFYCDKVS